MAEVAHLYQRHPHGAHGVVVAVAVGAVDHHLSLRPRRRSVREALHLLRSSPATRPPSPAGARGGPAVDVAGLGPRRGPYLPPRRLLEIFDPHQAAGGLGHRLQHLRGDPRAAQAGQGPGGVIHRAHAQRAVHFVHLPSAQRRVQIRGWEGGSAHLSPAGGRRRWYRCYRLLGAGLATASARRLPAALFFDLDGTLPAPGAVYRSYGCHAAGGLRRGATLVLSTGGSSGGTHHLARTRAEHPPGGVDGDRQRGRHPGPGGAPGPPPPLSAAAREALGHAGPRVWYLRGGRSPAGGGR